MKPDYSEYIEGVGEVRYYESNGLWRYICAQGEGALLESLEAAQAEVQHMFSAPPSE